MRVGNVVSGKGHASVMDKFSSVVDGMNMATKQVFLLILRVLRKSSLLR